MASVRALLIKVEIYWDMKGSHLTFLYNFKVKSVFSRQTTYIPSCTMKTVFKVQSTYQIIALYEHKALFFCA